MITADAAERALVALAAGGTLVQLHVGNPGGTGTKNKAGEDTRKDVMFHPQLDGTLASDFATWPNVPVSETFTHFTVWDRVGALLGAGNLDVEVAVDRGDNFESYFVWSLS